MTAATHPIIRWTQKFIKHQNRFQGQVGHWVAWGLLSLVVLSASVVILRYGFDSGSIALQETVLYNHAIVFMLGMGYALQQDKHVRVDVFYETMSPRHKAMVNLFGALFFALPTLLFIAWASWDYIHASWHIYESSPEPGGLAYVYILKSMILAMAALVTLQALTMAAESALQLFANQPIATAVSSESSSAKL